MDSQKYPLVSVLTPVYNGAEYIAECIESVLAQTYQNWEYIIVNNCSTDRTLEIARCYSKKDRRIRIHNNERFVGRMENHNIALRQISAESKYCKIVHADDWLFPECLMRMVELAEANPSVGIVGAYGLEGVRVKWDGLPYPSTVTVGSELCRRTLNGGLYVFGSPTSILLRSDLVRSCKNVYPETDDFGYYLYADHDACYQILRSSDFGFVHQVLTYSRIHAESVTSMATMTGLNPDLPEQLNVLKKYGSVYLSQNEYETRLNLLTDRYYSFLGQSLLYMRGKQFWDFHRRALKYVGDPLRHTKLLKAACSEVFDTLLNPFRMALTVLMHLTKFTSR
jgi:glycosyltransferase involved in cell wall biosynthesis